MSEEPTRGGFGFFATKLLLVVILIAGLGVFIYSLLDRLYGLIASSLGSKLAVVIISGATIGIMLLIMVGMGVGGMLEWGLWRHHIASKKIPPAPCSDGELFLKTWGDKLTPLIPKPNDEISSNEIPPGVTAEDIDELLLITEQSKRGGKKSAYTDDIQFRAVRDWMTMQAHGTSVTLQQFLEERFGTAPETGMPLVPNQTFYSWRKKFLKELKKYKKAQSKTK